jgi:hypothetical protein
LIEAGKLPYQKLMNTILPNTIAINCAIGNQNGFLTFYESTNLIRCKRCRTCFFIGCR